jgi:hypothetical protein
MLWRQIVDEGVRSRIFDIKDSGMAVRTLMGVLNWTLTWYRSEGELSIEKIANQYADLLLHGMLRD